MPFPKTQTFFLGLKDIFSASFWIACIGLILAIFLVLNRINPISTNNITEKDRNISKNGKSVGIRMPVVVIVVLLTRLLKGMERKKLKNIPIMITIKYWTIRSSLNLKELKPIVFKIPILMVSVFIVLLILWLSTIKTTNSKTSVKATRNPLNAFCKISIKPVMASLLWTNSV